MGQDRTELERMRIAAEVDAAVRSGTTTVGKEATRRGITRTTLSTWLGRWRDRNEVAEETGNVPVTATAIPDVNVSTKPDGTVLVRLGEARTARTQADIEQASQVDLARFYVHKFESSKHDVAMNLDGEPIVVEAWRAFAEFRQNLPASQILAAQDVLLELVADHAPSYEAPPVYAGGEHLLVIQLVDIHMGMLAWAEESGEDYNPELARAHVEYVVDQILSKAQMYGVDRILVPIGQDVLHADQTIKGKGGATTKGTPQDMAVRWQQMYRAAKELYVWVLDRCRLVAPTDGEGLPGNHGRMMEFALAEDLSSWYRLDDAVTIRNTAYPRSYYRYWETLLGLGHLDREQQKELSQIMAREAKSLWGVTSWREWLGGHEHRPRVFETQGVVVRHSRAMTATDSYHAENGYFHNRGAEGLLYDRGGYVSEILGRPPVVPDAVDGALMATTDVTGRG